MFNMESKHKTQDKHNSAPIQIVRKQKESPNLRFYNKYEIHVSAVRAEIWIQYKTIKKSGGGTQRARVEKSGEFTGRAEKH